MQNESDDTLIEDQPLHSGSMVAASLSLLLAFFTLMVSHHISRLSKELDEMVHAYGHWIPGSVGSGPEGSIGSYSGKETLALIVWFSSWLICHSAWRKKDLSIQAWTPIFLGGLGLITLGFFHPLIDPLVLFLAGFFGMPL